MLTFPCVSILLEKLENNLLSIEKINGLFNFEIEMDKKNQPAKENNNGG